MFPEFPFPQPRPGPGRHRPPRGDECAPVRRGGSPATTTDIRLRVGFSVLPPPDRNETRAPASLITDPRSALPPGAPDSKQMIILSHTDGPG